MKPVPDDLSEIEAPMTRALMATDADEPSEGQAPDPEGTLDAETHRMSSDSLVPIGEPIQSHPSNGVTRTRGVVGKIEPGQILYGKYQVLSKLGGGAMGDVWLIRHTMLKSLHALKVIIPNIASNQIALMRFQREFRVMASLRHEHAVQIYDACIDEDGGYIDMEFVEGRTLHEVLTQARSRDDLDPSMPLMPLDWIVRILDQFCDVLQVAHSKGIVHRDLKPSNLMLLDGREPGKEYLKVLDFGIAKIRDDPENVVNQEAEESELKTVGFIGTPSFGSPEQAMNREDVDARADLYSVGVMLYEFVTGRLPFRGNHWQVMNQHATVAPPPFSEANPSLRPMPQLERAILRILAKEREQRPQTARELFEEVRKAIVSVGNVGLTPSSWHVAPGYVPDGMQPHLPTEPDGLYHPGPTSGQPATLGALDRPPAPPKKGMAGPSIEFAPEVRPVRRRFSGREIAITVVLGSALVVFVVWMGRTDNQVKPPDDPRPHLTQGGGDLRRFEDYWPRTFVVVRSADRGKRWPDQVRRTTDNAVFKRFADGIYLPEGYRVESRADDLVDGWPRVIVLDPDPAPGRSALPEISPVRFVRMPASTDWVMGAWDASPTSDRTDSPSHPVALSGYYIQTTEVTNGQIEDFLKTTERVPPTEWETSYGDLKRLLGRDIARMHPAVNISHKLATQFADSLVAALPTEAQWEYAARSRGLRRRYVWGETPKPTRDRANIFRNDVMTTQPIGSFPTDRTEDGVFDLLGNVQEMCRDVYQPYRKSDLAVLDPCPLPQDSIALEYVIRGADYNSPPETCSTTRREDHRPEHEAAENLGFRLVVECPDTRKPR